jgi:hypothetical protein
VRGGGNMAITRGASRTRWLCAATFAPVAGAVSLSVVGAAQAQNFGSIEQAPEYSRGYNTAVKERPHPEWAPIDINLGGFTLQPQISLSSIFNDNEKYATKDAQADVSWRVQPALSLSSNWSRNGFGLQAWLGQTEYTRFSGDDTTEYGVAATGRVDASSDLAIDLRASDQHLALSRSDPDVPTTTTSIPTFDRQDFQATVTKTLPVFQLQGIVAVRNEDYGSTGDTQGGVDDFSARNGTYLSTSGRVSYGLSPAVAVFVGGLYNESWRPPSGGLLQDASGANLVGGVNFDLSRLARGEVSVGYLYQSYDTPNTPADSGIAFNVNLEYFPTQMTTFTLAAARSTAPSSVAGSPGGISTSASLTVDHELLRNVILSAGAAAGQTDYSSFQFEGVFSNRIDTSYGGNLGATYLMNRLMSWELAYAFTDYHSNARRSYTDNRLALTLRLTR